MPLSEFNRWRAFDAEEPIGGRGDDQRFNAFMKLFFSANAERGTQIPDFFQRWVKPKEETVASKAKAFFKQVIDNQNRKKKRKSRKAAKQAEPTPPLNNQNKDGGVSE